ncbi:type IX secretion system anionic LPS delivery protein PorZ [Carboxylicivirga linearis]|uniref:T9SS type A sorting domain-containing protein n=1 Tax=Carboxylicivirga linearis TaxID=1628157 RepID=A0ABS5JQA5_9BACT|nr:two-component regulator propeller domain-containing protein [Carboxylicivirga linearis]MBS2096942.1 T9SS type A sorting domain-containing protein [Carboxylicivirga linearis]
MKNIIVIGLLLLGLTSSVEAQWNNNWRDHFSCRGSAHVAESENYIIAANETGLIVYDYINGLTSKQNIVTGLSDVDISAFASIGDDRFIIGYENGNIDIFSMNGVINIPDLKNKQLQGSKQINHFEKAGDKVYCSTDFGILVIDILKLEIADTYYLGIESSNLLISECAVLGNDIYAATERGLLMADLNDPLIAYYQSWTDVGNSSDEYVAVTILDDDIVAVSKNNSSQYQVFKGKEDNWQIVKSSTRFKNIESGNDYFIIAETNTISKYDSDITLIETINSYSNPEIEDTTIRLNHCFFSDQRQSYLIADNVKGLVIKEGDNEQFILPNGPYSNSAFEILFSPHGLYSVAGALNSEYNNTNTMAEYSFFRNENWTHYKNQVVDNNYLWRDLIRICQASNDDDIVYMSSWGGGIFVIKEGEVINHYNHSNSNLQNIFPNGNQNYVRIGGIATDSQGNLWMSNSEVSEGIVVREGQDTSKWHSFTYETLNNLHSTDKFLISKDDYLWVIIPRTDRKGLFVLNTNGTLLDESDDQYRGALSSSVESDSRNVGQLKIWDESPKEITKQIYCIAEDKNGYIWLGTDKGVVVYYRPWAIFSENYPIASRIKVPRNDGTNQADYLLENENVTCIEVDGANRKWIGTQNSGLFLVSDDGITTYEIFNTDNSPLPSDYVRDVAIDPQSGEVFIATNKGIVSYKGKATEGEGTLNSVYAFPNPVREDFSGEITITGLVKDSNIKITTVSGKLVYETRSLGGRAYWNGRNFNGEKVKSGVYIAYISAEDGTEVQTTKIMIVR